MLNLRCRIGLHDWVYFGLSAHLDCYDPPRSTNRKRVCRRCGARQHLTPLFVDQEGGVWDYYWGDCDGENCIYKSKCNKEVLVALDGGGEGGIRKWDLK